MDIVSFISAVYKCYSRSSSVDEPHRAEERPQTPSTPPPPRTPPPEGTPQRRGDFTRQEYERRHQLKIMEDLDKVIRQKPTTVRGVKKQRPKTVFRDDSGLSRSPAKGFMGKLLIIQNHFLSIDNQLLSYMWYVNSFLSQVLD